MSSDGGATWSDRVQLNDDSGTNDQWQPALAVSPDGSKFGVFWYDRRLDASNFLIDRYGAIGYISGSSVIFAANRRISDVSFPPVVGVDPAMLFNYMGEYDQVAADNVNFYETWGDNRLPSMGHPGNKADVRFSTINPATQFAIVAPAIAAAGSPFTITVQALDAAGNIDTGYNGTVHFDTSDDPTGLPPDYTFTPADNGSHDFTVTLFTAGDQTLTATDMPISSITGTTTVTVTPSRIATRGRPVPDLQLLAAMPAAPSTYPAVEERRADSPFSPSPAGTAPETSLALTAAAVDRLFVPRSLIESRATSLVRELAPSVFDTVWWKDETFVI
jgi:hypothetical protein